MNEDKVNELKAKLLAGGRGPAPKPVSPESLGKVKPVPLKSSKLSEEEKAAFLSQLETSTQTVDLVVEEFGGLGLAALVKQGKF